MSNKISNLPHGIVLHLLMSSCLSCKCIVRYYNDNGRCNAGGRKENYRKTDNNVAQLDQGVECVARVD